MYRDLVEFVVKSLVDDPDAVEINESSGEDGLQLDVAVAPDDMGRVIGRNGRVVNAIRVVVDALATKNAESVSIEIN